MAITRSHTGLDVAMDAGFTIFRQKRDQIRQSLAKRKIYSTTLSELSSLSDRNLKDLGIPRSDIKRLAMEAAYGC